MRLVLSFSTDSIFASCNLSLLSTVMTSLAQGQKPGHINRTRQQAAESSGKRGGNTVGGSRGPSKTSPYAVPIPLYCPAPSPYTPEAFLAAYSLLWTAAALARSALAAVSASEVTATAAQRKNEIGRNAIPSSAYLKERLVGEWDDATSSVWVLPEVETSSEEMGDVGKAVNQNAMHELWTRGFYGKGNLSRSELTWWQREKNRVTGEHGKRSANFRLKLLDFLIRRGMFLFMTIVATAEDITTARRAERKLYKIAKAKERADERDKQASAMSADPEKSEATTDANLDNIDEGAASTSLKRKQIGRKPAKTASGASERIPGETPSQRQQRLIQETGMQVDNLEHMQLQREEALFLVLCSDALVVRRDSEALDLQALWRLFLLPPARPAAIPRPLSTKIRPDNPFILSYIVYHHYRSLGWVVRSGIKFCTDWVLYKGADGVKNPRGGAGPVGGHAEYVEGTFTFHCVADVRRLIHSGSLSRSSRHMKTQQMLLYPAHLSRDETGDGSTPSTESARVSRR